MNKPVEPIAAKPINPQVVKAAELRRAGVDNRTIAERMGVTVSVVEKRLSEAIKLGLAAPLFRSNGALRDRIVADWNAGQLSASEIGRKYDVTKNVVIGHINRAKHAGDCVSRRITVIPTLALSPEERAAQDAVILELWRAGQTSVQISTALEGVISAQTVRDRLDGLRRRGIDVPRRENRSLTRNVQMASEKRQREAKPPKPPKPPARVRVPTNYDYGTGRTPGERLAPRAERALQPSPGHRGVGLMELGTFECRYTGDARTFCAAPAISHRGKQTSWCGYHYRVCFLDARGRAA